MKILVHTRLRCRIGGCRSHLRVQTSRFAPNGFVLYTLRCALCQGLLTVFYASTRSRFKFRVKLGENEKKAGLDLEKAGLHADQIEISASRNPNLGKRDVGSYSVEELTVGKLRG